MGFILEAILCCAIRPMNLTRRKIFPAKIEEQLLFGGAKEGDFIWSSLCTKSGLTIWMCKTCQEGITKKVKQRQFTYRKNMFRSWFLEFNSRQFNVNCLWIRVYSDNEKITIHTSEKADWKHYGVNMWHLKWLMMASDIRHNFCCFCALEKVLLHVLEGRLWHDAPSEPFSILKKNVSKTNSAIPKPTRNPYPLATASTG